MATKLKKKPVAKRGPAAPRVRKKKAAASEARDTMESALSAIESHASNDEAFQDELIAQIEIVNSRLDVLVDIQARIVKLEDAFAKSSEQTRTELALVASTTLAQSKMNAKFTDAVFGDGKPGAVADITAGRVATEALTIRVDGIQQPLNRLLFIGIGLIVSIIGSTYAILARLGAESLFK